MSGIYDIRLRTRIVAYHVEHTWRLTFTFRMIQEYHHFPPSVFPSYKAIKYAYVYT